MDRECYTAMVDMDDYQVSTGNDSSTQGFVLFKRPFVKTGRLYLLLRVKGNLYVCIGSQLLVSAGCFVSLRGDSCAAGRWWGHAGVGEGGAVLGS